jgi:molybdopterin-containing oxidoreductase family iron-sulfur binding subunit
MSQDKLESNENIKQPDSNYWRSFNELYNDPVFIENSKHEFYNGVTDGFSPNELSGLSRRKFLALLGASAALAGAGCADYRDKGEIIPYNQKPEEVTLGKPTYYASTCTGCSLSCGILIKTREGRPIKIDGNPDHPVNQGKICAKGQANILNLYDPERLSTPLRRNNLGYFDNINWEIADKEILNKLNQAGDKEIAIITNQITSPSGFKIIEEFKSKFSKVNVYTYDLFNNSLKDSAWAKCYGSGKFPLIQWDAAKVVLSLEGDFLGVDGNKIENARLFSQGRDFDAIEKFNRLYVVEGNMSLTGMNADYRMRLRPDAQYEFVMCLINELGKRGISSSINTSQYSLQDFEKRFSLPIKFFNHLVNDLIANRGKAIVYSGSTLPENVHIVVNYLNEILSNTSLYRKDSTIQQAMDLSLTDDLKNLISSLNDGKVAAVIHYDSNPVYHLPSDLNYRKALSKAGVVITLTVSENESSALSDYVLPIHHNFESWGDAKTRSGFYSLLQPVISPITDTRQKEGILLSWTGIAGSYNETIFHKYLMNNWEKNIYPGLNSKMSFQQFWNSALHDGIVLVDEKVNVSTEFISSSLNELKPVNKYSDYVLVLKESFALGDGRFANNGFMQELPHPVSKVTWDNYAAISEQTSKDLNVKNNELIEVKAGNNKLNIPVFIQPGCADGMIEIELGYGREKAGVVGTSVGFNANAFIKSQFSVSPWIIERVSVTKAGGTYNLVSTQEHHAFDIERVQDLHKKRHIIQEGTLETYKKNPKFIQDNIKHELESVYKPFPYDGVKWGMAIDMNKCIGCGECIVACNVENNVPIVGKDQVEKGREMHWLRVDRYYSGTINEPSVSTQIMLCQQCDQAPCENVCPVVATNHSPDGLNQMVYNRCVGTRYCSNNCPYKVRRFNYFNFRDHFRDGYQEQPLLALLNNPEVTVRSRGVMEKCTFCLQRISDARSDAIREDRPLKGSDVTTACQDSCSTNAIKFGDINDLESDFSKFRNHELGYYVLEELNVKPNVTYLARLRNTHSEEA